MRRLKKKTSKRKGAAKRKVPVKRAKPVLSTVVYGARPRRKKRFRITVEVGKPYRVGPHEWACPVGLKGLHQSLPDVHGDDALHALCLAVSLAGRLLQYFKDEGGKVELALDSYFWWPDFASQRGRHRPIR
jgi:hypothetical protein